MTRRARAREEHDPAVVVLYTRDLRLHDHPALVAAVQRAKRVIPLFVFDDVILERFGAPNRVAFLLDALADLRASLGARGGTLVVRRGDSVEQTLRVALSVRAGAIHLSEDVSAFAAKRERRLGRACAEHGIELRTFPGITVVPPDDLSPSGTRGPYRVFGAYWARWRTAPRRALAAPPPAVLLPAGIAPGGLPHLRELTGGRQAVSCLPRGGEEAGRERLEHWLRDGIGGYEARRDDLAADATSGLSPYLHLGCVAPLEVAERARAAEGGEGFVRQLCWRDFHHQLLAADPSVGWHDLRPRGDVWRDDPVALAAWREGRTGYPIVDAGIRQLAAEGRMHNRARLVTASFLTKHLYLDWRLGAAHFAEHLVDGDVASNVGNWQWVAGTGADTRPNRVFNPTRQARRYDPEGAYVRRWVDELADVQGAAIHEPWRLGTMPVGYPPAIVDHEEAVARFHEARRRRGGVRRTSPRGPR